MKQIIKQKLKRPVAMLVAALALPLTAQSGHLNTVLEASLSGQAEVGESPRLAGDPNGNGEVYVFGIDNDPTTLCYVLVVDRIGLTELAAHIHRGGPDENGPVIANLAGPAGGDAADCLTEGEAGKFNLEELGTDAGIVQEILDNPGEYYVNVHNAAYPAGAIRGQLESLHDH